jgi:hypothetical protein
MNVRKTLVTSTAVALVASVAGVFVGSAASAEDAQPTYGLDLKLPDKIGAGGSAVPFEVKVTRTAKGEPVDLTLDFTGRDDLQPENLGITFGNQAPKVVGQNGKLQTVVTVPLAETELEKTLQFTVRLKVPGFGDGTERGPALLGGRLESRAQEQTSTSEPTSEPRPELTCAKLTRRPMTFGDLKLDASLRYTPPAVKSAVAATAEGASEPLATKSGTIAVGAPTVKLASFRAKVVSGGEARPVKIEVDNGTRSDYTKTFPYLGVVKQDLTKDDAHNVIVTQNGTRLPAQRLPVETKEFGGFFSSLSKLSVPAGKIVSPPQVKVGLGKDVKPGKALLVAVLADKAALSEENRPLSVNVACEEITVTDVDDSTPTPTPTPTEVTPPPSPTATPAPDTQGSPLAHTGANLMAGLLGAVLLLAGVGAVVVNRRRNAASGG